MDIPAPFFESMRDESILRFPPTEISRSPPRCPSCGKGGRSWMPRPSARSRSVLEIILADPGPNKKIWLVLKVEASEDLVRLILLAEIVVATFGTGTSI